MPTSLPQAAGVGLEDFTLMAALPESHMGFVAVTKLQPSTTRWRRLQ